jgi:hypothetical protein
MSDLFATPKPDNPMKVLVACESSGAVRDAFNALGHVATSCDLLPSETEGRHIQGDALEVINQGWDLIVAHPPCTYLSSSGMHWTTRGLRDPKLTEDALEFVQAIMDADCPRIAVENPVGCISTRIRKATQYINPHEYGHDASKKTGLWLKGLQPLEPTQHVAPRMVEGKKRWGNQCDSGQNKLGPSDDRWKERSKTYEGIARAMAEQWGGDTGWRHVCFAADVCDFDDEAGELVEECNRCGLDYADSPCPDPTQDGIKYDTFHDALMGRTIK